MDNTLLNQLDSLLECDRLITALSNTTALLYDYYDRLNWLGFYFLEQDTLYLGPFQGKVACEKIKVGKGVCGTAIVEMAIQNVPDVHQFKGHIACDSASNSEIVLPLFKGDQIFGVLDIDSPFFERFSLSDQLQLEECAKRISSRIAKEKSLPF